MVLVLVATQCDGIVAIAHSLVVGSGVEQRPDQVAQVVDIFIFRHQLCGQQDGVAVELVVPVSFDIAKGYARYLARRALARGGVGIDDIDPPAVAILGTTACAEVRAHAYPVVALVVLHHVAETVVGRAFEATILADLLVGAVDEACKVGDELRVHIDHSQVAGTFSRGGPRQRTDALDGDGLRRREFVELDVCQTREVILGQVEIGHHHDARRGLRRRSHADGGLVGLRGPVVGKLIDVGQDVQPGKGILGFVCVRRAQHQLGVIAVSAAIVLVVVLTGGDGHADASN